MFFDTLFKPKSKSLFQKSERLLTILLIALTGFFIANRNGRFYPSLEGDLNSFSSAERSYEYLDFYTIQRDSVISLAELQNGLPAFVTRGEFYYLSSPLMGYVKKQADHIFLIVNEPYGSAVIDHFPDDFLLLDVSTQPMHGGNVVTEILRQARANPDYSVTELAQFHRGLISVRSSGFPETADLDKKGKAMNIYTVDFDRSGIKLPSLNAVTASTA